MRLHPSDDNVSDAARLPKTKLDASVKTDRLRFCPLFNQDLPDNRRFLIAGWGRRAFPLHTDAAPASYRLWEFDNPDVALRWVELSEITGGAKYFSAVLLKMKGQ